jgi:signal transduction histidine kinase
VGYFPTATTTLYILDSLANRTRIFIRTKAYIFPAKKVLLMGSIQKEYFALPHITASEVERRVLELCDLEKRRIGQDLHDSIGQQLTGISLMSKVLEHRLREAEHPEADSLKEISGMVDDAIDEIREVVAGMAPSEIQHHNAADAIDLLCQRAERVHQIRCTLTCKLENPPTQRDIVKNLYFVAAESINNAIRHGEADQIDVHLRMGTGRDIGELLIRNNGACTDSDFEKQTGIGLSSMRLRAEALNGDMNIARYSDDLMAVVCTFRMRSEIEEEHHDNENEG